MSITPEVLTDMPFGSVGQGEIDFRLNVARVLGLTVEELSEFSNEDLTLVAAYMPDVAVPNTPEQDDNDTNFFWKSE